MADKSEVDKTFTREEIKEMIDDVRGEASEHNDEYAAGIRFTCVELEERIYG